MHSPFMAILFSATVLSSVLGASKCCALENEIPGSQPLGTALSDESLSENRGGQTIQTNVNNLDAMLYDNQAIANVTGSNNITTGALAGATGFPTVVQNSGNNVIIQNATIINLQVQ
jgi:hypothetical protein